MRTTSSRDSWERLVAAVIKREQIRQLCHQDSITTVDSDFSQRDLSLRSVPSFPSRPPLTKDSAVEVRKNGSRTITKKLFSALLWRKKHKDYDLGKGLVGIPEDHFGLKRFSLLKLQVATDNFNNQNFLGRGGLGNVYKGRLADGSLVAVIQKSITSLRQIEEELEILSIVKHCNVIGLLGLCITKNERLIVYPYMANGSVDSCLRGRRESQPPLGWETRLRIALGVARGLDYLHHGCIRGIIHRDVKAANILLDEDFEAVVSDLSWAIFTDSIDHVMRGTIGHIAPEYLSTGKCSWKTDVYGYGMFLLELITAQHGINPGRLGGGGYVTLLDWVKKLLEEKKCEIIVDPYLEGNYVDEEVEKLFQIALICTKTDPEGRPTMSEIVRMLEYGDGLGEAWEEFSKNYSTDLGEELVGIPEDHFGLKRFSLRELQVATDNFNNQKFLGRGGFGKGYKGRLADGSLVAVKDLAEVTIHEALEILSVVKHRNVICPLGGCFTEKNRLIVYPYMAKGSVASCLRERRESQPPLEWETRLRIALGVARGLDYLHHGGIIHRDVKAANILLDEDFEAVVSDFSLSIFMDNIDNGVRGTVFHIAPEYLSTGKCSLETDVYGYGIFLLELITAQRAFGLARLANDVDVMLLDWVKNLFEEKKFEIIVDRDLEGNFVEEEVEKLFQIVLICTQTDPEGRPTMSEIVRLLEYGDGLDDGREKFFQNVYQDENYSSKLHPSGFSSNAEEVSGPR